MSKKDKDIALFVAFCIEEYGAAKGMTGEQALDLFSQYGVTDYLSKCFEPLHTQGRKWLIDEIDEFIEIRKNTEAWRYITWAELVMANRTQKGFTHDYDIVYGPVANDRVYLQFGLYESGAISIDTLIRELKTYKLIDQYLFHTEKALTALHFIEATKIE